MSFYICVVFDGTIIDDAAIGCPMIHPKDFKRPCVDWNKVGQLIEKKRGK